jgi:RNA ligase
MFTLQQAYEALNGHDEFIVKTFDGVVTFDYVYSFPGSFDVTEVYSFPGSFDVTEVYSFPGSFDVTEEEVRNRAYTLWQNAGGPATDSHEFWFQAERDIKWFSHVRHNFRGIKFDEQTGKCISLPLHKFFNLNQTEGTQFHLYKDCKAKIYEKLDGSMVHFFINPHGNLTASTRLSVMSAQAIEATRLVNKNPDLKNLILETVQNGFTPIFELVSADNQVVVQYKEPRLAYLISRNRQDGSYLFEDKYPDSAIIYEFDFKDIHQFLDRQEFEGYVCQLDNGLFVKAKTPWYLERHRAVDALMKPAYTLYQLVFDGVMDDLISTATDNYKPFLNKIYEEAQRDLLNEVKRLEAINSRLLEMVLKEYPPNSREARKYYVQLARISYLDDFYILMTLYDGKPPEQGIQERLMEGYKLKYPNKLYLNL